MNISKKSSGPIDLFIFWWKEFFPQKTVNVSFFLKFHIERREHFCSLPVLFNRVRIEGKFICTAWYLLFQTCRSWTLFLVILKYLLEKGGKLIAFFKCLCLCDANWEPLTSFHVYPNLIESLWRTLSLTFARDSGIHWLQQWNWPAMLLISVVNWEL